MLDWYKARIKFEAIVEGKAKTVTELYALHCVSYGDVEATCAQILKDRVKSNAVDGIDKMRLSEVFIKDSVAGDESEFYQVSVRVDFGGKKRTEIYLLNASSPRNASDRVINWLKGSTLPYKIRKIEVTELLGIYDHLQWPFVEDFKKRQQRLADMNIVEIVDTQYDLFKDKQEQEPEPKQEEPVILERESLTRIPILTEKELDALYA